MSALDFLPDYVLGEITAQSGGLRQDLLLIPAAEAAGWSVSFRNDSWHNAAIFKKDQISVWSTGHDWRRAKQEEGAFCENIEVFQDLRDALSLEDQAK